MPYDPTVSRLEFAIDQASEEIRLLTALRAYHQAAGIAFYDDAIMARVIERAEAEKRVAVGALRLHRGRVKEKGVKF